MNDFFRDDGNDTLSNFASPKKEEKRPPEFNTESRKKKVENFVLHIEEFDNPTQEKKVDTASNRPKTKGEVYFANYQRSAGEPSARRYTGQTAQKKKLRDEDANAGRKKMTNDDLAMFSDMQGRARPPVDRPVSKAQPKNKRKSRRKLSPEELKKLAETYSRTFYIAMVCVLVFTVTLSTIGINCINDAIALSASDEEIEITIEENATTDEIIDLLKDNGLIRVKWFSSLFAKFRGYDKEGIYYTVNGEKKLQPYVGGTYYLSSSMGIEGMLNILLDNSASSEQTVSITFPEGYTIAQIVNRLEDYEVITDDKKFISAANYDYSYPFIDSKNMGVALKLEGYLFPDTYDMYVGESTSSIIKRFLDNFNEKWTDKYAVRAKELGYTTNEILTIASIIQKEAAGSSQMADISSVIHNRLKKSMNYPMLQCDSTANYVTNYLSDLLGENKASTYLDKYDTSVCMGLPEGPICNPGIDAINAALYPSDTTYLYFCHDKSGNVYYASTDFEHQQNVAKINK